MNQNILSIFIALYENGNMHKSAEALYMSQQAVSKSLRSLEEELDVKLFVRSNVGVKPTAAGDLLYQEAKVLQKQYNLLHKKLDAVKNGRKTVNLLCAYGTMYHIFPVIKQFESENPDIEIKWKEMPDLEVEKKLVQEEADLAVNVKGNHRSYMEYIPLYNRQICLLVYEGHRLYEREAIQFEDLQGERIVLEGEEFQIYRMFLEFCERSEVYPHIIAETSDIGFCQHMAELKEGLAITIDFVAQDRKLRNVRAIPFADPGFKWEIEMEIPANTNQKEEAVCFQNYLQSYFDNNQ